MTLDHMVNGHVTNWKRSFSFPTRPTTNKLGKLVTEDDGQPHLLTHMTFFTWSGEVTGQIKDVHLLLHKAYVHQTFNGRGSE